jgi:hypothetical protein
VHFRHPRLFLLATATATAIAVVVPFASANAAPSGDTTATFTVSSGTLDISVPATADLGTAIAGADLSGQLGVVTVADTRALLDASWTASAISTDFTTGGASPAETVAAADVDYWSGAATATTGNGTFTPGQATAADAVPIAAAATAFAHVGGSGSNSAAWNPTLVIAVPAAAVAGTYTGTITQSVA